MNEKLIEMFKDFEFNEKPEELISEVRIHKKLQLDTYYLGRWLDQWLDEKDRIEDIRLTSNESTSLASIHIHRRKIACGNLSVKMPRSGQMVGQMKGDGVLNLLIFQVFQNVRMASSLVRSTT